MRSAEIKGFPYYHCKRCRCVRSHLSWVTFSNGTKHLIVQCWDCGSFLGYVDQSQYGILAPSMDSLCSEVMWRGEEGPQGLRLFADVVGTHSRSTCPQTKAARKRQNKGGP